jgi:hypothetical protein
VRVGVVLVDLVLVASCEQLVGVDPRVRVHGSDELHEGLRDWSMPQVPQVGADIPGSPCASSA